MTELPGKEPDMPARISVGKLTMEKSMTNNKQKAGSFYLKDKITRVDTFFPLIHKESK